MEKFAALLGRSEPGTAYFGCMYVPTMSIPEAIAEAKADLRCVQNKIKGLIEVQQRAHRKDRRAGDRVVHGAYTSQARNNWLYNITVTKKNTVHNVFMWFHAPQGLFGLQLAYEGYHFLFTPHFFTRFRERSGEGAPAALENITQFFYRNPCPIGMRTGRTHLDLPAFIGAVPDGYVLGTLNEEHGYHLCRTYVHHDQAFANQQQDWEGLTALNMLRSNHPALFAQLKPGYKA